MSKNFRRFLSIVLSVILSVFTSISVMAAETETENRLLESQNIMTDEILPYATTVGECVFSLNNFGNSSGTALVSTGSQSVECTKGPTSLSYVALPKSGSGTVYIRFKNNSSSVELIADGKPHTTSIVSNGLQFTTNFDVEYYSASTPLVSISLVFSR